MATNEPGSTRTTPAAVSRRRFLFPALAAHSMLLPRPCWLFP